MSSQIIVKYIQIKKHSGPELRTLHLSDRCGWHSKTEKIHVDQIADMGMNDINAVL